MQRRSIWTTLAIAGFAAAVVLLGQGSFWGRTEPLRVVDGDTLARGDTRYRLQNIDTPETGHRAECDYERELAARATARMGEFVRQGVSIHFVGRTDVYGREIVRVRLNGQDVGEMLIEEGLAVEWEGHQADWYN